MPGEPPLARIPDFLTRQNSGVFRRSGFSAPLLELPELGFRPYSGPPVSGLIGVWVQTAVQCAPQRNQRSWRTLPTGNATFHKYAFNEDDHAAGAMAVLSSRRTSSIFNRMMSLPPTFPMPWMALAAIPVPRSGGG